MERNSWVLWLIRSHTSTETGAHNHKTITKEAYTYVCIFDGISYEFRNLVIEYSGVLA